MKSPNILQAPEPVESWEPYIWDAYQYGSSCVQPLKPFLTDLYPQHEDCLYLNVYVPGIV